MFDLQITAHDGRRIGAALFGDPRGRPIVYCHGFPASRLEAALAHEAAKRVGARLIALDRPGYGLSDFVPKRRIADWPADVVEVADAIRIDRFAVLGISGGAPYALACAAALPQRITAVAVVGGLGRTDIAEDRAHFDRFARMSLWMARAAPRISQLFYRPLGVLLRDRPEWTLRLLAAQLPPADRETLADPQVFSALAASLRDAFRQGGKAAAYELTLYARLAGLDGSKVRVPCYAWHGEADSTVPAAMTRRTAAAIAGCRAEFFPHDGHYSLPVRHMDAILASLLEHE